MKVKKLSVEKDEVVAAYQNGVTLRELATRYNVSAGTVRNLIRDEGLVLRGPGRPRKSDAPVFVTEVN